MEEIIDNMSDIDDTDVVIIPPNVDELTDKEDIDDTEMCAPDSIPNDITGTFEVMNIGNGAACTELASEPTTSRAHSSKHQAVKWQKAYVPAKNQPNNLEEKAVRELQEQFGNHSPFELFSLFFDNTVLNAIVNYSKKYACCKNRHNFHMDMNDLRKWLGIVILSGYHCLPQMELYWSLDEDKGVPLVRKTMSRNRFRDIKQNIHLSDNTNLQKEDKFAKVRPLFDLLNERFLQFGIFSHNLSIDEQMVPYFGRHSAKMFIRGKPVRFGFKIWCLTSSAGYLYKCFPYGGKLKENPQLGLGAQTVIDLLQVVKSPNNHKVYFDNFFTSYSLLSLLDEKGFYATGTIRENRTAKCLLETTKQIAKRDRGWFDAAYDKNSSIRMVRWNDNAVVTVASNIEEVEPIGNIKRYSRKEKREVQVKQPNIIEKYNSHMGGVDLHDNAIANYRIRIRGKKWWWPLFMNLIGCALVNAWKLHRLCNESKMTQLNFRSNVVMNLLKNEGPSNVLLGHSSTSISDARYDNVGHVIEKSATEQRRRCRICHSTTVFMCIKCNVHVHTKCFNRYHRK